MHFQVFSELAKLSGFTAMVSVSIGFFFGAVVLVKSIKLKQSLIFNFFLCIIFTLSPWYPSGLGYLYWVITQEVLNYQIYVLVGTIGIPIAIIAWLNVYMTTLRPEKKKLILILYGIFSLIFEIYLFFNLFYAPGAPVESLLGTFDDPTNPVNIDYRGFVLIYLGASILIACITGIDFSIKSIKYEKAPSLIWKGKFLLIAFILFGFSAIFDALIEMTPPLLIVIRITLVASNFFFYLGFILPKWMRNIFSIED